MTKSYYLDTSIWLDHYEKGGKNGQLAFKLIKKIVEEDSIIFYSDLHIKELKNLGYSIDQINNIFSIAKPIKLKKIHIFREEREEAKNISKQRNIPEGDILHTILCRNNYLQLISRDPHFEKLKFINITKKPEEFI